MAAKRSIIRLQIASESKQMLDELCDRRGMTQIVTMSRLVEWFAQQDDFIQSCVLNQISPDAQSDLAKKLLENQISAKPKSPKQTPY